MPALALLDLDRDVLHLIVRAVFSSNATLASRRHFYRLQCVSKAVRLLLAGAGVLPTVLEDAVFTTLGKKCRELHDWGVDMDLPLIRRLNRLTLSNPPAALRLAIDELNLETTVLEIAEDFAKGSGPALSGQRVSWSTLPSEASNWRMHIWDHPVVQALLEDNPGDSTGVSWWGFLQCPEVAWLLAVNDPWALALLCPPNFVHAKYPHCKTVVDVDTWIWAARIVRHNAHDRSTMRFRGPGYDSGWCGMLLDAQGKREFLMVLLVWELAPEPVQRDRRFQSELLQLCWPLCQDLSALEFMDEELARNAVSADAHALLALPTEFRYDPGTVCAAMQSRNSRSFVAAYCCTTILAHRELLFRALQTSTLSLGDLPLPLRGDREVARVACNTTRSSLHVISDELRDDVDFLRPYWQKATSDSPGSHTWFARVATRRAYEVLKGERGG